MISPQFSPLIGGYERACERLAVALVAKGHRVTVVAERRDKGWPKKEVLYGGVQVHRWWCVYRPGWHVATSVLGLVKALFSEGRRFQVWHVHQYGMQAAVTVVLAKLLGRPVVLKLTNTSDEGISEVLSRSRFPRLLSALHRRVDAVVALTRETSAEAESFGIPKVRINLLGNGVETKTFRTRDEKDKWKLKHQLGLGDAKVVLFVGRLTEAKNVEGLLDAWRLAVSRLSKEWRLVIVGDGPLNKKCQQLAKEYGITNRIYFAGQQENVEEWMGSGDIYVSTSWREGLSNTLLEAMAAGLPVVVTRVSGTAELVVESGAGVSVNIGDMEEIAEALCDLVSDEQHRQECGALGRRLILESYSIGVVARRHEALYYQLLNR